MVHFYTALAHVSVKSEGEPRGFTVQVFHTSTENDDDGRFSPFIY
jgi:hypothetical protein